MLIGRRLPLVESYAAELTTADGQSIPSLSAWDYLALKADNQLGLLFASLFWPEFVVVDRLIFLKELFDESAWRLRAPTLHLELVPSELQGSFNLQKIWDLLPNSDSNLESDLNVLIFEQLGEILRDCWQSKVNREFADVEAVVELSVGGYGPELTLWQTKFC